MKFTYTATVRDRYHVIRTIAARQRGWRILIGGTWAIIAVAAIVGLLRGQSVVLLSQDLLPWVFVALIWTAILPVTWFVLARAALKSAAMQGDHTIELTDSGLRESGQVTATVVRWSGIVRVVETPDSLLFFYAKSSAFYLPRSAVPLAEIGAVRAFISAHVPADRTEFARAPGPV